MLLAFIAVISSCILQYREFFFTVTVQCLTRQAIISSPKQQEGANPPASLDGGDDDAKGGLEVEGIQRSGRRGGECRHTLASSSAAAPNAPAGDDDDKDIPSSSDEQILRIISQTNRMQQLRLR